MMCYKTNFFSSSVFALAHASLCRACATKLFQMEDSESTDGFDLIGCLLRPELEQIFCASVKTILNEGCVKGFEPIVGGGGGGGLVLYL